MKCVLVLIAAAFVSGCGISSIRCEIITDEELLRSVLMDFVVGDVGGVSTKDE